LKPALSAARSEQPSSERKSDHLDARFLEGLVGYNARRAAVSIIERFLSEMDDFKLRPVEFSVLCLIYENPGITSRQLSTALAIHPPNLVSLIANFEKRGLVIRKPHPFDGRAVVLSIPAEAQAFVKRAQQKVSQLEQTAVSALNETEQAQLIALLQKIYK
jgi:DNA-binding MarR family transcriptional regulator